MKKFLILALLFCVPQVQAFAYEDPLAQTQKSLKDYAYVVETDEEMSAESLERISGQYDLGFTLPDQEYHSSSHNRAGPFSGTKSQDNSTVTY